MLRVVGCVLWVAEFRQLNLLASLAWSVVLRIFLDLSGSIPVDRFGFGERILWILKRIDLEFGEWILWIFEWIDLGSGERILWIFEWIDLEFGEWILWIFERIDLDSGEWIMLILM